MTCDRSTFELHVFSCYVRGRGHGSRVLPLTKEGAPACDHCVTVPGRCMCLMAACVSKRALARTMSRSLALPLVPLNSVAAMQNALYFPSARGTKFALCWRRAARD